MRDIDPNRILVGLDGSGASIDALRVGVALAEALFTPLDTVTVWDYPSTVGGLSPFAQWTPEKDARRIVKEAVEEVFNGSPPEYFTHRLIQGAATRVLLHETHAASMLVMGSRGRGGVAGLLLGSVSMACAEHAHCPVLIMHGPKDAVRAGAAG